MMRGCAKCVMAGGIALFVLSGAARAQSETREVYTPAETIDAKISVTTNGLAVFDAPAYAGLRFTSVRRDRNGEAELHNLANEHIYILEGRIEYEVGGTLDGSRSTAANEWRGGEISQGRRYVLKPGDAMYVPAGVPHRIRLAPGVKSVRYIGVKINSPAKP